MSSPDVSETTPAGAKARETSVRWLQELYTIVIGLAIVQSLEMVFGDAVQHHTIPTAIKTLMLMSFLVTVVPFYHGANRYLDDTYVERIKVVQNFALLVDFFALLLEGILFYVLILYSGNFQIFYSVLAGLFIFDAVWVGITRLIADVPDHSRAKPETPEYGTWAGINLFAAVAIYIVVWSDLFKTDELRSILLLAIAVLRTVYDYYSVWKFYYPPHGETANSKAPAPRPAAPSVNIHIATTKTQPAVASQRPTKPKVVLDETMVGQVIATLRQTTLPPESESVTHATETQLDPDVLANCYLAIVAMCHQTSPVGERRLEGSIGGQKKYGWDYLKERFLEAAKLDPSWGSPEKWSELRPEELSALYNDSTLGLTLNRIVERTHLLNDLGNIMRSFECDNIRKPFEKGRRCFLGSDGLATFLRNCEAFSDPLQKKTLFLASILQTECGWKVADSDKLESPVDYHEVRGHLRIGTVAIRDKELGHKASDGLPLTVEEDLLVRSKVQEANRRIASELGVTTSRVHYLLWNVFRNCCPREAAKTHCAACGEQCALPKSYKELSIYDGKCVFSTVCQSSGKEIKVSDPPYLGHFY